MLKKLLFIFIICPAFLFAQHTLKGTFSPAKDFKQVILYKVEPTTMEYVSHTTLNEKGEFTLELSKDVKAGIYRLTYGVPQEEKNFDIIYNAKENVAFKFSVNNLEYTDSNENLLLQNYNIEIDKIETEIGSFYKAKSTNKDDYKKLFINLKTLQEQYEEAAKNNMALSFIKANKSYYPESLEDIKTYKNNIINSFFDAVDFNDETLQSSSFLAQMIFNYVFILHKENEQAKAIDTVVEKIGNQDAIKKNFLELFWYQTSESKSETLANYITTTYLLDLANAENDAELVEAITVFKNISLGETAPDFSLETSKDNTTKLVKLSSLEAAENYVLFFWSSTCSHCLKEIPQLRDFIKTKEHVKVIAIGLEDEPYRWKNETYDYPDFVHVYGEGKWDNEIGNSYGISGTPTYFILDKDKKIIAKPDDIVVFKKFFEE